VSSADGGDWVNERGTRQSRENCERALRDGQPIEGTVAERHLIEQRGLQQPFWPELRYLADARTGEGALIAPLTVGGKVVGVQATFIDPDGRKSAIDPARETWKVDEKPTPNAIFDLPHRGGSDEIVICDGVEDALTVWTFGRPKSRVIGLPGQWALRHLEFPAGTRILVVPDGDPPGSQGALWLHGGVDHLLLSGCQVSIPLIPPVQTPKLDASEILRQTGVDGLLNWLDQATPAKLSDDGELRRLAKLTLLDYARERVAAAKRLGISVKFIDQAVENMRKTIAAEEQAAKDDFLDIGETRPWDEAVDGAELLDDLARTIRSYVVMTPEQTWAVSLWILFTWCFAAAVVAPKLWIKSAEKRSGKSRLMELLYYLCRNPLGGSRMSPAAFYRLVEARDHPTLLLDEADTFIASSEDFRGLLDAGFDDTEMAKVWICVGDDHVPTPFSVFTPTAIAGISRLKDTVADRCIRIELERKARGEQVARLRRRDTGPLADLARKCARWAADNVADLTQATPDIPEAIHDRAADGWDLLLAIADHSSEAWGGRARRAALLISGDGAYPMEDESVGIQLLGDMRDILTADKGLDRITSADLVERLNELEDRPWPEFVRGKPLTRTQLARLLRPFRISPGTIRITTTGIDAKSGRPTGTAKGYKRSQFRLAFERYLPPLSERPDPDPTKPPEDEYEDTSPDTPPISPDFADTPTQDQDFCGFEPDFEPSQERSCDGSKNAENASVSAACDGVTANLAEKEGVPERGASEPPSDGAKRKQAINDRFVAYIDMCRAEATGVRGAPNGVTDSFVPISVEEGARYYATLHPGWSLARIAKELAVPVSRIEALFPDRAAAESPLVIKVRATLAEHPDWTAEQISKHIKRPGSAVNRALHSIGH
jgi:hypothetical protein